MLLGILLAVAIISAVLVKCRGNLCRSQEVTHWTVLLGCHGTLATFAHLMLAVSHLGEALMLMAMLERVVWQVSDDAAAALDRKHAAWRKRRVTA